MTPNFVHMHLLLNHVPTIGTIVALGLLLLAFAKRSEELKRGALALFFATRWWVWFLLIPAVAVVVYGGRDQRRRGR